MWPCGRTVRSDLPLGLKYVDCLRSHGLPNIPDPGSHGGGSLFGAGINPQSPAFQSAVRACQKLQPGGNGPPTMSEARRLAALKFASCVRKHGLPDFPDPVASATGNTPTLVIHGLEFTLGPGLDPRSPVFRQAAAACGLSLPERRIAGPPPPQAP